MMDVLFPDGRYVVRWVAAVLVVVVFLLASDGADAALLCTTAVAAFWARDCLGRLRQWEASALVPGYALTTLVMAVGIVGAVATMASTISYLAGNKAPAFGLAALAGFILVVALTYAKQPTTIHRVVGILGCIVVAVLIAQLHFGSPIAWPEIAHPLIQWSALAMVAAAIVALKGRLDQPVAQRLESPAMPWDHFRPFVAGPKDVFGGWMSRTRVAEGVLVAIPFPITLQAYDALDSIPSLLTAALFYAVYIGALTPLLLLKGAGRWLSTAWQLGSADSRKGVGQMFASRTVIATAVTLAVVLLTVGGHALVVPSTALWPGHRDLVDEVLLLYTVGFAAFAWACYIHPPRTTRQPAYIGMVAIACVIYLVVFHKAPTFEIVGRVVLLLVFLSSIAFAVYAGGRALARIDFLPTNED